MQSLQIICNVNNLFSQRETFLGLCGNKIKNQVLIIFCKNDFPEIIGYSRKFLLKINKENEHTTHWSKSKHLTLPKWILFLNENRFPYFWSVYFFRLHQTIETAFIRFHVIGNFSNLKHQIDLFKRNGFRPF